MTQLKNDLMAARALVERGWCQGISHDNTGSVDKYCVLGAIDQASSGDSSEAKFALRKVVGGIYLADWNDAPERTKADVLAAFDRAIEAVS
jgi:hypothetical protein